MSELKKWGHNELQEDLAAHIRANSDRLAWTNMPMGSVGNCRPDVFAIPKSFANFKPIIYEIKVSVSDFRSDITSGKWQSYLKYACGVIFAVPAGLITKADVPVGCGLIVRNQDSWRMAKSPTMQYLETLPKELWIKLLIDGIERQSALLRQSSNFSEYSAREKIKHKYGERIAKLLYDLYRAESNIQFAIIQANNVEKEIEDSRQKKLSKAREEDSQISQAKSEFCTALGIPTDSTIWTISRKCHELQTRLDESQEIARLKQLFSKLENVINSSKEQAPLFQANHSEQELNKAVA